MSKFDYDTFIDSVDTLAVSKEKYTKEEAIELAKKELDVKEYAFLTVSSAFVRYRYGVDLDGEKHSCWWLEYVQHTRSCPCWTFHLTNNLNEWFNKNYEYIKLR